MLLTAHQLNHATLHRQLLLRREGLPVIDAVRRIGAIQAQEPASPYVALWSRLDRFDPLELDRAFADGTVVKASLMRITLHAVHAADYPVLHAAMQRTLRASRLGDRRFTAAGLSIAEADALVPPLLEFAARPRTNTDMAAWLADQLGTPHAPAVWWALRTFAPLTHAPTGGPWTFGPRPSYTAARTAPHVGGMDEALQFLVRRYLEAFGPASVRDVAQFAMIPRGTIREVLASMGGSLVPLRGADGTELFDVPGGHVPPEEATAPPRLLPMWDSVLLAYADRSRIIPPEYRRLVTRQNGDVLPTLLVDGYVAGVWRPVECGIEATAFHPLADETWEGIASESRALSGFLAGRDPAAYRRYGHWWATLPASEVRMLGGDGQRGNGG